MDLCHSSTSYRRGVAQVLMLTRYDEFFYSPGLGKPDAEFEPRAWNKFCNDLANWIVDGGPIPKE